MYYGQPNWQWDTQAQVELFEDYLLDTKELQNRGTPHGYKDCEWEAFQYGWNAALEHYKVKI